MEELKNVTIAGVGVINEGKYKNVSIYGSGKTNGDIECEQFECDGAAKINGNIMAEEMQINGATTINGDVKAIEMEINGSCSVKGTLYGRSIEVNGSSKVTEDVFSDDYIEVNGVLTVVNKITANKIEANGVLKADSVDAENFKVSGGVETRVINAEYFSLEIVRRVFSNFTYKNSIKEIYGNEITIKESNKIISGLKLFGMEFNFGGTGKIIYEIDTIEGDNIFLENVVCNNVRGKNVTISKNSVISNVEYTDTLNIIDDGEVENSIKI